MAVQKPTIDNEQTPFLTRFRSSKLAYLKIVFLFDCSEE
jgi:hypothetical protein